MEKEVKMQSMAIPVNHAGDYMITCPECAIIYPAKHGVAICPQCYTQAPHPSDLVWIVGTRKYYYDGLGAYL
jgi:uncharacterized Zn finger protein (UPF0148 family)